MRGIAGQDGATLRLPPSFDGVAFDLLQDHRGARQFIVAELDGVASKGARVHKAGGDAVSAPIRIPNNWAPRDYQMNVWRYLERGGKRAICVWHRRAGPPDRRHGQKKTLVVTWAWSCCTRAKGCSSPLFRRASRVWPTIAASGAPRWRREGGDFKRLHRARAIIAR
jgi:hypothetical protein